MVLVMFSFLPIYDKAAIGTKIFYIVLKILEGLKQSLARVEKKCKRIEGHVSPVYKV